MVLLAVLFAAAAPAETPSLSVSWDHACMANDAQVHCWGAGSSGQSGGARGDNPLPQRIPVTDPVRVATSQGRSCAVRGNGDVWCWGSRMGDKPTQVPGLSGLHVAMSGQTTCVLDATGTVTCEDRFSDEPIKPPIGAATRIESGMQHICAVAKKGPVQCWGAAVPGRWERKGDLDVVSFEPPEPLIDLALGGWHTCGLGASGAVYCVGANDAGQMGDGKTGNTAEFQPVPGLAGVTDIDASYTRTCALNKEGVWCWGVEEPGSHVDGPPEADSPELVPGTEALTAVEVGTHHACGVNGEAVVCWGGAGHGALGDGSGERRESPGPIGAATAP